MNKKYAIGLMSGTSLDGVDAVLVSFEGAGIDTKLETIAFESFDIPERLRDQILRACQISTSNVALISSLNFELGKLFSDAVTNLLDKSQFKGKLDFIASHGQTIFHMPIAEGEYVRSTLQIGDPSYLAYDHKTRVVFNFRVADMVDGGDGAPLVPYTEYLLYRQKDKSILLQNIGGIGNVTIIPKNASIEAVSAFDTGPGNMMMNAACAHFYNVNYDKDGLYAKEGKLIEALYESLLEEPYLKVAPPKSTGRELFGEDRVLELCQKYTNANDVIYTLTKFTAYTISQAYRDFIFDVTPIDQIIIGGGGAYNPTLMEEIRNFLPEYEVIDQEALGYSSDAKEAIAFALLGNECLNNIAGNVPGATGSKNRLILGQVAPNPWPEKI